MQKRMLAVMMAMVMVFLMGGGVLVQSGEREIWEWVMHPIHELYEVRAFLGLPEVEESEYINGMRIEIRDGRAGVVGENGNVIVPFEYAEWSRIESGVAIMSSAGEEPDDARYDVVYNNRGELIVPFWGSESGELWRPHWWSEDDGEWRWHGLFRGIIGEMNSDDGLLVVQAQPHSCEPPVLIAVYDTSGGRQNIDVEKYWLLRPIKGGNLAALCRESRKWGVIDRNGNVIVPFALNVINDESGAPIHSHVAGYWQGAVLKAVPMMLDDDFVWRYGVARRVSAITPQIAPLVRNLHEGRFVNLQIGNNLANSNGLIGQIDFRNEDVVPIIYGDRTMLPIRFVGESWGLEVHWFEETQTVWLWGSGRGLGDGIFLTIGQLEASVHDYGFILDVAPMIREGRTLVPLRFIAESMGLYVDWCEAESVVSVWER